MKKYCGMNYTIVNINITFLGYYRLYPHLARGLKMSDRTVTIPDEILDSVISDSHIEIIARKYLVNWETLRPHLSHITEAQEQNIANRQDQDDEWKRRRLLSLWKKEAGDEATYRSLITAAEKSGDFNLANNIRKLLHNEIPSTPSTGIILQSVFYFILRSYYDNYMAIQFYIIFLLLRLS